MNKVFPTFENSIQFALGYNQIKTAYQNTKSKEENENENENENEKR